MIHQSRRGSAHGADTVEPRRKILLLAAFSLLLAILAVVPNLTSAMPGRDSGVFLYVGWQILEGKAPYVDVWDHKGPLMYFINAAAVGLDPGGEVGIWLLEVGALGLAGVMFASAMHHRLGTGASVLGLVLFFGGLLFLLRPGNYTEEFALPVSLGALALLVRWDEWPEWASGSTLGAALAASLLLRPNLSAIPALVAGYVLFHAVGPTPARARLRMALWMGAGLTAIFAPVLAYLGLHNALSAGWDAYIIFNFAYLGLGPTPALDVIGEGLNSLLWPGTSIAGVLGWALFVVRAAGRRIDLTGERLLAVAAVDLPLEVFLTAVGGRGLTHYYISWLPSLAVLGGAGLDWFVRELAAKRPLAGLPTSRSLLVLLSGVLLLMPLRRSLPNLLAVLRDGPREAQRLAVPFEAYPNQRLLMWGAETAYHYFSGRPAASRFVYQYPLYTCGYATPEMVAAFRRDIEETRPLIVDTSSGNRRVPPLDPNLRSAVPELAEECALSSPMVSLMETLWAQYREVGRMPDTGWPILAPGTSASPDG